MDAIETFEHDGTRVHLVLDEDPMSPREWDNLGTMVCGHSRYDLGDVQVRPGEPHDIDGTVRVSLPLYLYDHSGLSIRTGGFHEDPGGWDSGQVGIIYVTVETLEREGLADRSDEEIARYLEGEVETYDQYLRGEVYGYVLERVTTCDQGHEHAEIVDSCYGFFGELEYVREEALAAV